MTRAIIDIGTNTTHLLIGRVNGSDLKETIIKSRFYTFLGEDGLLKISKSAIDRLFNALEVFHQLIDEHEVQKIQVIATDALRNAENGMDITSQIYRLYGWSIDVISGEQESELIYNGVIQAMDLSAGSHLIMDVGGGSVEFIWVLDGQKKVQKSYPIGISRLHRQYHIADPFESQAIEGLHHYVLGRTRDLFKEIGKYASVTTLIGCAGTFEIFLNETSKADNSLKSALIPQEKLENLLERVMHKSIEQRILVKGIPKERAQYIVVALLLVEAILGRLKKDHFVVSKYALKEGAIVSSNYFLD